MIDLRPRQALSRLLVEWVRGLNSPGLQASTVQTLRRGTGDAGGKWAGPGTCQVGQAPAFLLASAYLEALTTSSHTVP